MQTTTDVNSVELCGVAATEPVFTHTASGWDHYGFMLDVPRLSGRSDRLSVSMPSYILLGTDVHADSPLRIRGSLRSRNVHESEKYRLLLAVRAAEASLCEEVCPENRIEISGSVCRPPVYRETPLGRRVCDVMLAVRRRYGKSDFLPLIVWGENAVRAGMLSAGDRIGCVGRFQSREYIKRLETGEERRTAYEVSVSEFWTAE
ncbi:MAG: single-stranded DNA-binding protein [Clostridiales bacterium]|nr:single-stranded DNA-binding protein [Clostridiales bacterium]